MLIDLSSRNNSPLTRQARNFLVLVGKQDLAPVQCCALHNRGVFVPVHAAKQEQHEHTTRR